MEDNKWKDKNEDVELDKGNWGELLGDDFKINPEDGDNFDDLDLEDFDLDEDNEENDGTIGLAGLELGELLFEDYDGAPEEDLGDIELGDIELGDEDDDDEQTGWNFDGNWDFIEEDWD